MGTPASQVFAPNQVTQGVPNQPKDWYSYQAAFAAVANGVPQSLTIQIEQDSDFWITSLQQQTSLSNATPTEATNIIPMILIMIIDSGSGRQLFNSPVQISSVCGTGQRPHYLRYPRLVRRSSSLQVSVLSYDATTASYGFVKILFEGFKQYGTAS